MSFYEKPPILHAVSLLQRDGLIEASAGTGKTYTIAHLVVELVLADVPIQDILVVTFTEKAAAELKGRIRELLSDLVNLKSDQAEAFQPQDRSQVWILDPVNRRKLTYALEDLDLATIATIHGFCNRVLSEFAFENNRPFDQVQVSPDEGFRQLFGVFLQQLLADADYPLRTVLTHFIANKFEYAKWLYSNLKTLQGIRPSRLLPEQVVVEDESDWLRFAAEFKDWSQLPQLIENMNIHGGSRNSQVKKSKAALDSLTLIDVSDWISIRDWLASYVFHKDHEVHLFSKPWDQIKFSNKAKPGMVNAASELPAALRELAGLAQQLKQRMNLSLEGMLLGDLHLRWQSFYAEQKAQRGWFDFDDMIDIVAEQVSKDHSSLLPALQARYSHALIDEFQDTDTRQWSIFKSVFLDSQTHRLYLIGDPKQAIYAFRGADVYTYLNAAKAVTEHGSELSLDTNFRSCPALMDAFNRIFRHPSLFKADGGIRYSKDIQCGFEQLSASDGEARALTLMLPPEPEGNAGSWFSDYRKQALPLEIAREVARLLADNEFHLVQKDGERKALRPQDIAILVGKRKEANQIGEALRRENVPFAFYKQAGLFETEEARQLYDMLEAVMYPRRDEAIYRALMTDFFDISLETLLQHGTVPDSVRQQCLSWHQLAVEDDDLHGFFDNLFAASHIFERLMLLEGNERAITNYRQLADLLLMESNRMDFNQLLRHFLDYREGRIQRDDDLLRLETEREAVQIMTIHVSKGLQFPVVFVYGGYTKPPVGGQRLNFHDFYDDAGKRIADLAAQHEEQHRLEREREAERLYYVALTRAEYKLYLAHFPLASQKAFGSFNGPYRVLQQSLDELAQTGRIHQHEVPFISLEPATEASLQANQQQVITIDPPQLPAADHKLYSQTTARNPIRISSYTKLSRGQKSSREGIEQHRLERAGAEDEVPRLVVDDKLRGRDFGIAVHEVLEEIDALRLPLHTDLDAWVNDTEAMQKLATLLYSHQLESYVEDIAPMIWHASKAPVPPGVPVADIASKDRMAEVDFYLYLENKHREQVFLQGSIDLVYRYQGRYYFADWKSDLLEDYSPTAMADKVTENYRYQYLIYTEATLRWLGIIDETAYEAQFGGLLYLFVRGMDQPQNGIYFQRPTWQETRQHWAELQALHYD
jgi:exodeoxyribonuclease V beta subunit